MSKRSVPLGSPPRKEGGGFGVFLSRLPDARPEPSGFWRARCPVHEDRHPSLRFKELGNGGVFLQCMAGCSQEDILRALGLSREDLQPADPPGVVRYAICDPTGRVVAVHVRWDSPTGKRLWWELPSGEKGLGGLRVTELPLYGVDKLGNASMVVVTEGEKAAEALLRLGIPTVGTVTGAETIPGDQALQALIREGRRLILWPDADPPGMRHMVRLGEALKRLGARDVRLVQPPRGVPSGWDAYDAVREGRDVHALLDGAVPFEPEGRPAPRLLTAAEILGLDEPSEASWVVDEAAGVELSHDPAAEGQAAPGVPAWPDPPDEAAYHGLAGEVVRTVEPHTEADPVALLVQFLAAFGSAAGRRAHIVAEADRHYTNLYVCLVGATAKARKGSSWGHILHLFEAADPDWARARVQHGLSSGEGLIWAVRDAIARREPIKEKGRVTGYQEVEDDPGVADKRLLVVEAEFASVLKMATREGNTLSQVLRQAWDRGDLRTLVKHSPARATGAHISLIGHVTREELLRYLDSTEAANGFANRFIWLCVRRSKVLPEGGRFHEVDVAPLVRRLRAALEFARTVGEVRRDEEARAAWREVYPALSEGKPGLLGAMIARAEAQVMRLALIYALLDGSAVIRGPHLDAALALWDYAEASARWVFSEALGDPVADTVLDALKNAGEEGLSRTELHTLFGRNVAAKQISRALTALAAAGLVRAHRQTNTGGRPAERWFYVGARTNEESPEA